MTPPTCKQDATLIMERKRTIFVTVGTTLFESLTEAVSDSAFLSAASDAPHGYTDIVVQYGKGKRVPFVGRTLDSDADARGGANDADDNGTVSRTVTVGTSDDARKVRCRAYRFKPTLEEDMAGADLIISHAGAGSIMEGLALCRPPERASDDGSGAVMGRTKKLVVVVNSMLMCNHQHELAEALSSRGYLYVVYDPADLRSLLGEIESFVPIPFPGGDAYDFVRLLDRHMGFAPS